MKTDLRPNLIFVFCDQLRQQAVGFSGQDPVITPHLNHFAGESLVLSHAISNCPICTPYRGMLMTGQYPFTNGLIGNTSSATIGQGIELRENARCFSNILEDSGYSTGYIGKWHLDLPKPEDAPYTEGWRGGAESGTLWDAYTPPGPRRHGFQFWHSYGCCDQHLAPHYWENEAPLEQRIDPGKWSVEHETDVALAYLRNEGNRHRDPGKPFALFLSHNPPHSPYDQVPPEYREEYGRASDADLLNRSNARADGLGKLAWDHAKNYFAAVTGVDRQLGRLLKGLRETGLTENTIVVFTSDHGEMMGSQGLMYKNVPYDESIRVPFAIRWPGNIRPGTDDLLLGAPDIMPTLLGLLDLGGRIPDEVEGRDYSTLLTGGTGERPHSAPYFRIHIHEPLSGMRGVRTHRHTYVVSRDPDFAHGTPLFLFDNRVDPFQLDNRAAREPEVCRRLHTELADWLRRVEDPWRESLPADPMDLRR